MAQYPHANQRETNDHYDGSRELTPKQGTAKHHHH